MADKIALYTTCSICQGTGLLFNASGQSRVCESCNGEKYILSQLFIDEAVLDKLNDILDKCNDIFEKVSEV